MSSSLQTPYFAALALTAALTACGGDGTSPEEGHTPASAAVFVGSFDVTDPMVLPSGEMVRVELKFYDEEGEEITGIEATHFASLAFTPSTLATVADVEGEPFRKDVTGGAGAGSGMYSVGYGHDETADELTFGPFDARVVETLGGSEVAPMLRGGSSPAAHGSWPAR